MKKTTNQFTTKRIALIGVMAALVLVSSMISIPLFGDTRIHLGNVLCLLSGFLLGPVAGGLSAGIGSAFFDLLNPMYIRSMPFTFVFKFAMAFVAGKLSRTGGDDADNLPRNFASGAAGALTYVILYVSKNFITDVFFSRMELKAALILAAQKLFASGVNALLAVVIAAPLALAIRKGLKQARVNI